MRNYGNLRYRPDARDPAALHRRLKQYEEKEQARSVAAVREYDEPERPVGRPPKTVPQEIAAMMVADLRAGRTVAYVWRKFNGVCDVHRSWISRAWNSGRLELIASGD